MGYHFLLITDGRSDGRRGQWRFLLEEIGGRSILSATDCESLACCERLELLALVRGLEAIDRPARVTLVTQSRYVVRGLKRGLADWRAANWKWERFGQFVPVRDHDLWRRVDRALDFHQLDCRLWQVETPVTLNQQTPSRFALSARRRLAAAPSAERTKGWTATGRGLLGELTGLAAG